MIFAQAPQPPCARYGDPEEVAHHQTLSLVMPAASYITTARRLPVDGGLMALCNA